VLLFFSITKIVVALSRGRSNIGFLLFITVIALVFAWKTATPRLTARGEALLDDVKNLFLSLKLRGPQIRPGGASTELVMLAAVFGISALPRDRFAWASQLFPRADASDTGTGTSCGSSCGSSCGGGCGGGCGGCGG
jgi:hypothetical protein